MNIEINMDSVVIEKQIVKRPDYISRSEWLAFWEAKPLRNCYRCGKPVLT